MKFNFKKKYGQNFLTDINLLDSIVSLSGANQDSTVLEIGPGAGALTSAIARVAKKVISFEIDNSLEEILKENLSKYGNSKVIFKDFMKLSDEEIYQEVGNNYMVIANLPYYITSPILFRFFEMKNKPKSLTIMVQKEYGERMCAKAGDSEYSSLSVLASWLGEAKIVKKVPRHMFTPAPKVDSVIVNFEFGDNTYDSAFALFIRNCFQMRRKTLINNLSSKYDLSKDYLKNVLIELKHDPELRAEDLNCEELLEIYTKINIK